MSTDETKDQGGSDPANANADANMDADVTLPGEADLDNLEFDQLKETAKAAMKAAATYKGQKDHYKTKFAKTAEELAKATKPADPNAGGENKSQTTPTEQLSKEEIRLIAQGVADEEIDQLKIIVNAAKAGGQNISLADAQKNPMYLAYKEKKEAEEKEKKKQMGGSGSGSAPKKDKPNTSGMSREEHMKLAKEKAGQ
jgi:hypothetical protein